MTELLRSPLFAFAVVGLVLFGVVRAFDPSPDADRDDRGAIDVERQALLDFVQLRSGEADAARLEARWDRLSPAARQVWVDRFVREEALVREARRLGLDRTDDLIRRRLVQQMEFLAEADADASVDAATLDAAYAERAEAYRVPAVVTFGHVFVRDPSALERGAATEAAGRAEALREALNEERIGFDGARARGDRFLYNRVYVDRTLDEVRAHFGPEMAAAIAALSPDDAGWQGPIASQHGWHVVLLTRRTDARVPSLEEVRETLAEEIRRERRDASLERGVDEIVAGYEARVASDVHRRSGDRDTGPVDP